jgi:hypothetical protein
MVAAVNMPAWLATITSTGASVLLAVLPLVAFFIVFQILFLRLPMKEVARILAGTGLAALGLLLFLLGVGMAFLPFGRVIGEAVGSLPRQWQVVLFGVILGFVTTWSEPAVRILADQVEEASAGSIRGPMVVWAVCIGVALSVGLGLLRISDELPLLYLLVPGYLAVIVLLRYSRPDFVGVAADAGGVATGPLANSFLLALALGASSVSSDKDALVHGLGLVALIALAPVLSLMVLGVIAARKEQRKEIRA